MSGPRTLIALHRAGVAPGLADGLAARGVPVQVTRNMADTWLAVRDTLPQAVIVAPLSSDIDSVEFASLMRLSSGLQGPAVLVLTDGPEFLEPCAASIDDYLPTAVGGEEATGRLRLAGHADLLSAAARHERMILDEVLGVRLELQSDDAARAALAARPGAQSFDVDGASLVVAVERVESV